MTDQTAFEAATRRLSQALDTLEAALERRLEVERDMAGLADQLQKLGADRSRLASELDVQTARSRRLEEANRDIAGRLDAAMVNIRSVLNSPQSE
jgi:hypothetical protein